VLAVDGVKLYLPDEEVIHRRWVRRFMMCCKKAWSMPRFFLSVEKEHRGGSWDSTTSSNGVLVRKLKKSYDPV
jgi:hypothetical protein